MNQSLFSLKENYLSVKQSTALKGLFAIGVLVCHVVPASGLVANNILSPLLGSLGYLCVAAFFFMSGYGIAAQYYAKGEQYLKGFLKNRVLSIYLLTLFLIVVYAIFRILVGVQIPMFDLLQSFLIGNTIVSNGWYLQVVVIFYLFWYLTVRFIKKEKTQFIALLALVLTYMLIGRLFLSNFWYQSSLGFLLGVYWQKNKQKIDNWLFLKGKRPLMLILSFLGFFITYALSNSSFIKLIDTFCEKILSTPKNIFTNIIFCRDVRIVMACLSAVLFVIFILALNTIFSQLINCGLLKFLGKYSLEIYVLQGIPLHIFKVGILKIENGYLYIVCVILSTIILAVVMHPLIKFITNIPKKYLNRGVI